MEEFVQDSFEDSLTIFGDTVTRLVKEGDKFSSNAVANITIYMKDFHKLMSSLVKDVESGKIGKTPRRFNAWKKRNEKKLSIIPTILPDGETDNKNEEAFNVQEILNDL